MLLKGYMKAATKRTPAPKRQYLAACEYVFDDGASTRGHGDALLYDTSNGSLIVLEVKLCRSDTPAFTRQRAKKVRNQAHI